MDSLAPPVPERFDDMSVLWRVFWYLFAALGALLLVAVVLASL